MAYPAAMSKFVQLRDRAGTLKRWLDSLTEAHDRRHDAPAVRTWRRLRLVNRWAL